MTARADLRTKSTPVWSPSAARERARAALYRFLTIQSKDLPPSERVRREAGFRDLLLNDRAFDAADALRTAGRELGIADADIEECFATEARAS